MEDELQNSTPEVYADAQEAERFTSNETPSQEPDVGELVLEQHDPHSSQNDLAIEVHNQQDSADSGNPEDVMHVDAENSAPATTSNESKANGLPLSRIRAIINADPDVSIVSKAAVILITKATELFIAQISSDAARHLSSSKRKTIQLSDIAAIVNMCDEYAFLDGMNLVESNKQGKSSTPPPKSATPPLQEVTDSSNPQEVAAE